MTYDLFEADEHQDGSELRKLQMEMPPFVGPPAVGSMTETSEST
jgi:hypothetical protein